MTQPRTIALLLAGLAISASLPAFAVVPEASRLKEKLKDEHASSEEFWIYNNLPAAMEEARRTNRPIFVTFRCVPCKACAGFDAEVASGSEVIQQLAKDKFVSLRQVEMKGVDLSQFQFDYDLNWAAMFINPDGTVYARYGTQSEAGPDAFNSIKSLQKTMERVLELHADYPNIKAQLTAKRGADKPYKTPLDMPGMENRERLAGETQRNNCVHCHMIHDAEQNQARAEGTFTQEMLKRWPLPDFVGLHIDRDDGRIIAGIVPDSAAAKSSLKSGDEITQMNGQAISSIADMQWVLYRLPNTATKVNIIARRSGQPVQAEIQLADSWKQYNWRWRGSRWSLKPKPGFWAPLLKTEELEKYKLPADTKAYRIQFLNGNTTEGKAAQKIGLREGDIIVQVAGKAITMTPEEFQMHVRMNYKVGQSLPLTILRNGKRQQVDLPLVE